MRKTHLMTAMLFTAAIALAGCSDDHMNSGPPPAAPSIANQDNASINHEEVNPSVPVPDVHSMPAQK